MRSSFGSEAQALRARSGLSQTEFAARIGESLARVSNLEYQRTNIGDEVLDKYVSVLAATPEDEVKLRDYAAFSNARRGLVAKNIPEDQTLTLLARYMEELSPAGKKKVEAALKQIREVIAAEKTILAETVDLQPNQKFHYTSQTKYKKRTRKAERPSLWLERFIEICLLAEEHRARFASVGSLVNMEYFMQQAELDYSGLCFDIVEKLPPYAEGAFALIIGSKSGHRIVLEEKRFFGRFKNNVFIRHGIAHEFAHHCLHGDLLVSDKDCYLPPQDIARLPDDLESDPPEGFMFKRRIETLVEEEAECFATLFLVPWTEFYKGRHFHDLWKTFKADPLSVERYWHYFKQPAVRARLNEALIQRTNHSAL